MTKADTLTLSTLDNVNLITYKAGCNKGEPDLKKTNPIRRENGCNNKILICKGIGHADKSKGIVFSRHGAACNSIDNWLYLSI